MKITLQLTDLQAKALLDALDIAIDDAAPAAITTRLLAIRQQLTVQL